MTILSEIKNNLRVAIYVIPNEILIILVNVLTAKEKNFYYFNPEFDKQFTRA